MTQLTIVGNLVADPELKFTKTGKAVTSFCVAVGKRQKTQEGNWVDGESSFYNCSIWEAPAEHLAESLVKGQRVIVVGEIAQRSYENNAGEKRTVFEVTATEVGPSLKWALCKPEKVASKAGGYTKAAPVDDPWSAAPTVTDEPPF